jgi:8-oxo-dGTP diphosphatase
MSAKAISETNFCIRCGTKLTSADYSGRRRPVCPSCGWIYFADPKVASAALIVHEGKVLLVRRANNPYRGLWTLPAGFVDAGEDPVDTIERECLEEMGLKIRLIGLFDILHGLEHPHGAHILIVYRAELIKEDYNGTISMTAGDDVDSVAFFPLDDLPPLAFSTTDKILAKL